MNRRMKTTWSVDNIEVKDNFYDYVMTCRHRQERFPSSQLKGSVSLLFKSLASFRQILAIGTIREQIFGRFLFGENVFIKDCSTERNGTKLYSMVRGKRGKDLFFHGFYCDLPWKNSTIASTYFSDTDSS